MLLLYVVLASPLTILTHQAPVTVTRIDLVLVLETSHSELHRYYEAVLALWVCMLVKGGEHVRLSLHDLYCNY